MSDELDPVEIKKSLQKAQDTIDEFDSWLGRVPTRMTARDEDVLLCHLDAWVNRNHTNPQTRLSAIQSLGIQLYGRHIQLVKNELIFTAQNTSESLDIRQACLDSWYEITGIPSHRRLLKTIEEFFGQ